LESDDLEAYEESVFELVINWVKEDEEARTPELDRLLPLVRFPLMAGAPAVTQEAVMLRIINPKLFLHALLLHAQFVPVEIPQECLLPVS
jgi:hypothetical protein